MKRLITVFLAIILAASLAGCGGIDPEAKRYAFVTDSYGINASPEVESVWLGVRDYSNVLPCVATSYTPLEDTLKEYKAQIKTAVKDGAKIVVCYGENMSVPVYNGQKAHKKIKFVLINAVPMPESEYKEKHKDDPEKKEAPRVEPEKEEDGENAPEDTEGEEPENAESPEGTDSENAEDTEGSEDTASAEIVKMGVFLTASEDAPEEGSDEAGSDTGEEQQSVSPESAEDENASEEGADKEESEETGDDTANIRENTCVVKISFRDVGFLAGYAAVAEGYTNIAFMGGEESETNDIYLNGFIEGADAAAKERALPQGGVTVTYGFTGSEELSPMTMSKALDWYENGAQTIFAPGENICKAVVKAAETRQTGNVMTVGTRNKADESEKIVFTVIMNYGRAAYSVLQDFENDEFEGGKIVNYGLKEECVTIPDDLSRLTAFNSNTFEILKNNIKGNQIKVTDKEMKAGGDVVKVTSGL